MGRFNIQLDKNGNVSNIVFPCTKVEAGVEYKESVKGEEAIPNAVVMNGKKMSVEDFQDIQTDETGKMSIKPGASKPDEGGNKKPWWEDLFGDLIGSSGNSNIGIVEPRK